ncbi:MAG TPA: DNA polymerase [Paracoccus sp. (in: a-proteobacteria)]|uniref:DNA polymerase n=1 Tax=Paracoccus sp. TaxID=267 RepID=UPI002C65CEAB|nr:DNA polymerase [Paracoccus sp. (in: a-proteobacteria)]HWL56438.1 DNA polymerase [Paracoccus sp. (in: a-proteobacteria)]
MIAEKILAQAARHVTDIATDRHSGAVLADQPGLPVEIRDALITTPGIADLLAPPPPEPDAATAADILADEGVTVVYVTDAVTAGDMVLALCLSAMANRLPIGVDIETAALSAYRTTQRRVALTKTGRRAARQKPLGDEEAPLDPHRSRPRLFQAYAGGDKAVVFDLDRIDPEILRPLTEYPWTAANAKFEAAHLSHAGFPVSAEMGDCLSLMWHIDGGRWAKSQSRSLARAVALCYGVIVPKALGASDWSASALSPEQIVYAALDAVLAHRLHDDIWHQLSPGQQQSQQACDAAIHAVACAELQGIAIDETWHRALITEWQEQKAQLEARLLVETGGHPLKTPAQIAAWIALHLEPDALESWPRTDSGQIKTDKLAMLRARQIPGIATALELKRYDKMLSSFGQSLLDKRNPVTGKLHTSFRLPGAKTGRLASTSPNLQQMPKRTEKAFRRSFVADPGCVLLACDFSQMELRAAALLSQDSTMLGVYERGDDLHMMTAQSLSGRMDLTADSPERTIAKAANFGLLFGTGAARFADMAFAGYGVDMSIEEAAGHRDGFFSTYPGLRAWQGWQAASARKQGYTETVLGRRWYWAWERFAVDEYDDRAEPDGFRYTLALNMPVQGSCSEIVMLSLAWVADAIAPYGALIILQVHDELVVQCPDDPAIIRAVSDLVTANMADAFLAVFPTAPVTDIVDVKIGYNWGEMVAPAIQPVED